MTECKATQRALPHVILFEPRVGPLQHAIWEALSHPRARQRVPATQQAAPPLSSSQRSRADAPPLRTLASAASCTTLPRCMSMMHCHAEPARPTSAAIHHSRARGPRSRPGPPQVGARRPRHAAGGSDLPRAACDAQVAVAARLLLRRCLRAEDGGWRGTGRGNSREGGSECTVGTRVGATVGGGGGARRGTRKCARTNANSDKPPVKGHASSPPHIPQPRGGSNPHLHVVAGEVARAPPPEEGVSRESHLSARGRVSAHEARPRARAGARRTRSTFSPGSPGVMARRTMWCVACIQTM